MPDWLQIILVPAIAGIASYVGTVVAVRVDIVWIKKELADHDGELKTLHSRINGMLRAGRW